MATYDSVAVANEFVRIAASVGRPVTHMKLQKLVFFAHGWQLGILGEPLIDERVQAWKYGPVVPSVYFEFRQNGGGAIITPAKKPLPDGIGGINWIEPQIPEFDNQTHQLIKKIWDVYGCYSAMELSDMTHRSGTPWADTVLEHNGVVPPNTTIENSKIAKFFRPS